MKGMDMAAERVVQAIDKSESVLIYGDYDLTAWRHIHSGGFFKKGRLKA